LAGGKKRVKMKRTYGQLIQVGNRGFGNTGKVLTIGRKGRNRLEKENQGRKIKTPNESNSG